MLPFKPFIAIPDILNKVEDITASEIKLIVFLIRETRGKYTETVVRTDDELLFGTWTKGRVQRHPDACGIKGRNNLKTARNRLLQREWIKITGRERAHSYQVNLRFLVELAGAMWVEGLSESDTTEGRSARNSVQNGQHSYKDRDGEKYKTENRAERLKGLSRPSTTTHIVSPSYREQVQTVREQAEADGYSLIPESVFDDVLLALRSELSPYAFDLWIRPLRAGHIDGDTAHVLMPNALFGRMVEVHRSLILAELRKQLPQVSHVRCEDLELLAGMGPS
jgi:hypothetical protein